MHSFPWRRRACSLRCKGICLQMRRGALKARKRPAPPRVGLTKKTTLFATERVQSLYGLGGPISRDTAILSLRYPFSRDTFSGRLAASHNGAIPPPLVLSSTEAHLCDTPLCSVSRENCAIPHQNKHERVLRYYLRESETTIKIKFAFFGGVGGRGG